MKDLNLSNNNINVLPKEVGELINLKLLWVSSNQIESLPSEIGNLNKLEALFINDNQLIILPSEICKLKGLTTLSISRNQLKTLPSEFGNLLNLIHLDIECNNLKSLPKEIGKLKNITRLYLRKNKLKTLPLEIGNLKKLTNLFLKDNELTYLPKEIGELAKLTNVFLSDNELTYLPKEIGNLTNLVELDLKNNKLTSLPIEIKNLKNLNKLDLRENQLKFPPTFLGNLPNLCYVYLGGNPFESSFSERIYKIGVMPKNFLLANGKKFDIKEVEINFIQKSYGWIVIKFNVNGEKYEIDASDVFPPFEGLIKFLENIITNNLPDSLQIDEEGKYKHLRVSPENNPNLFRFTLTKLAGKTELIIDEIFDKKQFVLEFYNKFIDFKTTNYDRVLWTRDEKYTHETRGVNRELTELNEINLETLEKMISDFEIDISHPFEIFLFIY